MTTLLNACMRVSTHDFDRHLHQWFCARLSVIVLIMVDNLVISFCSMADDINSLCHVFS